jgi:hypothetical protein
LQRWLRLCLMNATPCRSALAREDGVSVTHV